MKRVWTLLLVMAFSFISDVVFADMGICESTGTDYRFLMLLGIVIIPGLIYSYCRRPFKGLFLGGFTLNLWLIGKLFDLTVAYVWLGVCYVYIFIDLKKAIQNKVKLDHISFIIFGAYCFASLITTTLFLLFWKIMVSD